MKDHTIHDELKEFSPTLSRLKEKPDPMMVPPDYFEQNVSKTLAQMDAPPRHRSSAMGVWIRPLQWAAAAAVAAVAVAVWGFWEQPALNSDAVVAQAAPMVVDSDKAQEDDSAASAEEYVRENILEFDETLLLEALESEELAATPAPASSKTKKKTVATDEHNIDDILDDLTEEELEDLL